MGQYHILKWLALEELISFEQEKNPQRPNWHNFKKIS